jgi:hypothetical protein
VCIQSSSVQNIQIGMVLDEVHYIQIDREVAASNFEVMGKLLDVDNRDEDESAVGDRYVG